MRISAASTICIALTIATSCSKTPTENQSRHVIKTVAPEKIEQIKKAVESTVTPTLAEGLNIKLWGVDSLVIDPVSVDVDDNGALYYTRANRQKNSEFDIRGHQDWELRSIALQSIDDKRKFLHEEISPENSKRNGWLADLNGDGSHDWKDMAVEKEQIYRVE